MRVRALDKFFYGGQDRTVGEIFDTENDMHAKLMALNQKVEMVIESTDDRPKRSGRYKRSDMRAEE